MKYKVFFHQGDELGLKTKVSRGEAWVDEMGLHVVGKSEILISKTEFVGAELFRLHGVGSVIRLESKRGRLFVSVVRFMIGQCALINYVGTCKLLTQISTMSPESREAISNI